MALHSSRAVIKTVSQLDSVLRLGLCQTILSAGVSAAVLMRKSSPSPHKDSALPWATETRSSLLQPLLLRVPFPAATLPSCSSSNRPDWPPPQGIGTCSSPAWNPSPSKATFKCNFLTSPYFKNCPDTSSLFSLLYFLYSKCLLICRIIHLPSHCVIIFHTLFFIRKSGLLSLS